MRPSSFRFLLALMAGLLNLSVFSASFARSVNSSRVLFMPSIIYSHPALKVTTKEVGGHFDTDVYAGEIINYGETTVYEATIPIMLDYEFNDVVMNVYPILGAIAPGQRVPFEFDVLLNTREQGQFRDYSVFNSTARTIPNYDYRPITVLSHEASGVLPFQVTGEIRNDQDQQLDVQIAVTLYDVANNFVDGFGGRVEDVPAGATVSYRASTLRFPSYHHYVVQADGYR
jgi:hypothetical protein